MFGLDNPSSGSGDLKRGSHGLYLEPKECISWKVQWNKKPRGPQGNVRACHDRSISFTQLLTALYGTHFGRLLLASFRPFHYNRPWGPAGVLQFLFFTLPRNTFDHSATAPSPNDLWISYRYFYPSLHMCFFLNQISYKSCNG